MGNVTIATPISGTVGTSYNLPVYQLWNICSSITKIRKATKNAEIGVVWEEG